MNREILVVGPPLAELMRSALPDARLSSMSTFEALAGPLAVTPDLVVIDAADAPVDSLITLISMLGALKPQPATLLVGAALPTGLIRALLKMNRSDVLEAPFALADLARATEDLLQADDAAERPSRCWSIMGAVGGAGATTIAVELATLLAERHGPGEVCLVDLNLADGAAAAYLGATANLKLARAAVAAERLDATVLAAFIHRVPDGPDLLAAPRDLDAFGKVDTPVIGRLLEVTCEHYRWVVIDLPRHRHGWTLDVLAGSDEIIIVSELTVPALLSARALADDVEIALAGVTMPRIVLNRLAKRMLGPAPSVKEAERALQRRADAAIASDWEAAAASVNLGGAISRHHPRSKIVRDIRDLMRTLSANEPVEVHAMAKVTR